jgi:hypothetical protein
MPHASTVSQIATAHRPDFHLKLNAAHPHTSVEHCGGGAMRRAGCMCSYDAAGSSPSNAAAAAAAPGKSRRQQGIGGPCKAIGSSIQALNAWPEGNDCSPVRCPWSSETPLV